MKKIFAALSLLLLSTSVFAWTIGPMNYQGRLLDGAGIPQTGTYNFTVNIYDALTNGTLKFSENQNNIAVTDGVYSFLVSTGVTQTGTWDINLWNTPTLYLEIVVNGQTLTPRHLLAAAPFAFQANLALTTNNALALGGVSATQYQNTLASICVSGKGKWLELVSKCLGIGSSFPGPTRVNWNTLTASNNFSNLDLSRADISGIDFFGANLQKTIFNQTTYSAQGLNQSDLTGSHWDSAIATDTVASTLPPTRVNDAYFTNMDLSKWHLGYSGMEYVTNMSAANLSACPAPARMPQSSTGGPAWECRLMYPAGSNYFMVGEGVNLSSSSAAASVKNGVSMLDLDVNALNGVFLLHASFIGALVTQNLVGSDLRWADFSYATLRNLSLNANTAGTVFAHSKFDNVLLSSSSCLNGSYTDAELTSVLFNSCVYGVDFTRAKLRNVTFTTDVYNTDFTLAILDNVVASATVQTSTFNGTHFYNGFFVSSLQQSTLLKDLYFSGGRLSGNLMWQVFTGTITFQNVVFDHVNLCSATIPLVDKTVPSADLKNDFWGVAVCPNGHLLTGAGDTCNISTRMTASQGSCDTASIP